MIVCLVGLAPWRRRHLCAIDPTHTFVSHLKRATLARPPTVVVLTKAGLISIDRAAKTGKAEVTIDTTFPINTGTQAFDTHLKEQRLSTQKPSQATFQGDKRCL